MSNSQPVRGKLFVFAAPSGGGKTSLIHELLARDPRTVLSVSYTTRAARPGEIDGQHYHFVSETVFLQMIENGEFIEYARVFDHFYGTSRNSVMRQLENGHDVLLDIDWQGARQVRAAFPDCCSIFILPPSLDTLRARLKGRAQDSDTVIERRMRDARAEISHWDEFDHLLVNDDFNITLEELFAILNDHRYQRSRLVNKDYQHLAQQLGKR